MIAYEKLPLDNEVKAALEGLEIEYVFQPIFYKDCVRIYAYEALMRPKKMTVGQLIDEFARDEKLHILEVATFFGATQAYIERGYQEYLCINSFPSESFTENEAEAFDTYFGNQKGKRIIEILEYPKVSLREWVRKSEMVQNKHWKVSLDDFGMGENNMNAVYLYTPDIVKLDRSLICGIDNDARKQENVRTYLESFHERGMQVLAEGVETREECDFTVFGSGSVSGILSGYAGINTKRERAKARSFFKKINYLKKHNKTNNYEKYKGKIKRNKKTG